MHGINIKVANAMLSHPNNAFPVSFPETKLPSLGLLLICKASLATGVYCHLFSVHHYIHVCSCGIFPVFLCTTVIDVFCLTNLICQLALH